MSDDKQNVEGLVIDSRTTADDEKVAVFDESQRHVPVLTSDGEQIKVYYKYLPLFVTVWDMLGGVYDSDYIIMPNLIRI
tara:strand:+ start:60 stop:296 length:237 start_codon:yes stop_codon:yes gene_type:complete